MQRDSLSVGASEEEGGRGERRLEDQLLQDCVDPTLAQKILEAQEAAAQQTQATMRECLQVDPPLLHHFHPASPHICLGNHARTRRRVQRPERHGSCCRDARCEGCGGVSGYREGGRRSKEGRRIESRCMERISR
eukprot:768164-Hanusia_phi.AAC.5